MKVSSAFFTANTSKVIDNTATATFNTDGKATASC
jgi:hypothetical protein